MTDNRLNSLNDYEQLKRKNRRRLVGASVMVLLAGLLLAKVLNQSNNQQETAQNISINGDASDAVTASETIIAPQVAINNQAASADDASDLSPAAVLEPAPEGNTRSTELANPLAGDTQTQAASTEQPQTAVSEPAQAETPKPAAPAASRTIPAPAVIINNNRATAADKQAAEKAAAEKQAAAQRAAEARKREAAKQAEQKKAQAARAQAKKQTGTAQKTPQASTQSGSKADPQAILEGRAGATANSGGKAIIQAGAYSNQEQARQIQQKLSAAGVNAYISEAQTSKGKIYRVRTNSYASRAAANQALEKIRGQGVDAMVIGQ